MQEYYFGWLPDYPDLRDYTVEKNVISEKGKKAGVKYSIKEMALKTGISELDSKKKLPLSKDLRKWCSPVEDQGSLGSCTANAGIGLLEYFPGRGFRRARGGFGACPPAG